MLSRQLFDISKTARSLSRRAWRARTTSESSQEKSNKGKARICLRAVAVQMSPKRLEAVEDSITLPRNEVQQLSSFETKQTKHKSKKRKRKTKSLNDLAESRKTSSSLSFLTLLFFGLEPQRCWVTSSGEKWKETKRKTFTAFRMFSRLRLRLWSRDWCQSKAMTRKHFM